jgi:hypothetical protein
MSTQQLSEYIIKNLKKGYTIDSLRFSLVSQGYTKITVENAIDLANKSLAKEIPAIRERPEIVYKVVAEPSELSEESIKPLAKKSLWSKLLGN